MDWVDGSVRVRVPATSANLGPGFDALGLALALHDDVEAWIMGSGHSIEISGEGADLAGAGEKHLVLRAMRAAFDVTGGQPPGIGLRCVNRIPHGRGLGSSAAAIVAGILAARSLAEKGPSMLPLDAVLELATGIEGHPDNVAACLGGGLTIAWMAAGHPRMVRLEPLPWIKPVVCIAPSPVRTDVTRGLLPDVVPHKDAAANAARSALLVAVLTQQGAVTAGRAREAALAGTEASSGQADDGVLAGAEASPGQMDEEALAGARASLLLDATQDWLHQDYRAAAMPQTYALVRGLRAAGIPAVVSGAGPSVLAFPGVPGRPGSRHHLDSLGSIVRETGIAWHISSLDVEREGARVLRPESSPGC
jgi:homoserine kinase